MWEGGGVRTLVQKHSVGDHGVRGHQLFRLDAIGVLQQLLQVAADVLSPRPAGYEQRKE